MEKDNCLSPWMVDCSMDGQHDNITCQLPRAIRWQREKFFNNLSGSLPCLNKSEVPNVQSTSQKSLRSIGTQTPPLSIESLLNISDVELVTALKRRHEKKVNYLSTAITNCCQQHMTNSLIANQQTSLQDNHAPTMTYDHHPMNDQHSQQPLTLYHPSIALNQSSNCQQSHQPPTFLNQQLLHCCNNQPELHSVRHRRDRRSSVGMTDWHQMGKELRYIADDLLCSRYKSSTSVDSSSSDSSTLIFNSFKTNLAQFNQNLERLNLFRPRSLSSTSSCTDLPRCMEYRKSNN